MECCLIFLQESFLVPGQLPFRLKKAFSEKTGHRGRGVAHWQIVWLANLRHIQTNKRQEKQSVIQLVSGSA